MLSNRTIALCAVLMAVTAGLISWLLLTLYGRGTQADQIQLDAIRTVGTIVLGAGGAIALLLAARRQQTAEQELIEKRRDLALRELVQQHTEKVAADNHNHQRRVADASTQDATERRITDLYTRAVEQLGSDKAPVRLAGLYALERLAQDNPIQRTTIANVICAYLRMPYTPPGNPPDPEASKETVAEYRDLAQEREVRRAGQRIITQHMLPDRRRLNVYWGILDIDLAGATLIDFNVVGCQFGTASFCSATFVGETSFDLVRFSGEADFDNAQFPGDVTFDEARFSDTASFDSARFESAATFDGTEFTGSASFTKVRFGGHTDFDGAQFTNAFFDLVQFLGNASFDQAQVAGLARFDDARFLGTTSFDGTLFKFGVPAEVAAIVTETTAAATGNSVVRDG